MYTRPRVPGARIFFIVCLADRSCDLLLREIDALRAAVSTTRRQSLFHIDAWGELPDHMHCIWTLLDGDTDYSAIKARPTRDIRRAGQAGF